MRDNFARVTWVRVLVSRKHHLSRFFVFFSSCCSCTFLFLLLIVLLFFHNLFSPDLWVGLLSYLMQCVMSLDCEPGTQRVRVFQELVFFSKVIFSFSLVGRVGRDGASVCVTTRTKAQIHRCLFEIFDLFELDVLENRDFWNLSSPLLKKHRNHRWNMSKLPGLQRFLWACGLDCRCCWPELSRSFEITGFSCKMFESETPFFASNLPFCIFFLQKKWSLQICSNMSSKK